MQSRVPLVVLGALVALTVATGWAPAAGRLSWILELGPMLVFAGILAALYPRMPLSNLAYVGVLLHSIIVAYGGFYTYAETPLGNWMKATFHLARNPYDRVGHLAFGFFPVLVAREILLKRTPLQRGAWLTFLLLSVILAIGAAWEILEWWTALVVAPDVGNSYLGTQGDPWDAQWDMLLAVVGAALSLLLLSRAHDRSMARLG